jgi:signal transduction histidine kinase
MWTPSVQRGLFASGVAVVVTLVLDVLWLLVPNEWGEHVPFSLFLIVVGGCALLGGVVPGFVALLLGAASGLYIGEPRFQWTLRHAADWVLLAIFVVTGPFVILACASLRRAIEERRLALLETERRAHVEAARLNVRLSRALDSERAARASAEHASRLKDEFVATVSHELRTPLNAIMGWAVLLQRAQVTPDELTRGLAVVVRNGRALTQLVSDLLDTSRMVAGKVQLEITRESLPAIVEAALDGLRHAALAKRIELRAELAPAVVVVADAGRLQQVVWNLVSNAIKFTPEGGRITVSAAQDDAGRSVLRVRDDGEGIAPELLPHVFERFRQGDASLARQHGGLGLGLAIARELVELHGGTIEAKSEGRGRGAELTVTLPSPPSGPRPMANGSKAPARVLEGGPILVVDEELDARDA